MAPPPPPPDRSGLSPWAWAGIGCGSLAVIAVVALAFVFGIFVRKAKEITENPASIAEFIINQSPDVELVSRDDEAETMTIRNTKDGSEITVNFSDLQDGNITLTGENGAFNLDLAQDNGTLTIETPEGKAAVGSDVALADLPDWVPVYPGSKSQAATLTISAGTGTGGHVVLTTPDDVTDVAGWMRQELESSGLSVAATNAPAATSLEARSQADTRTVNVSILSSNGSTTISLKFAE